MAHFSVVVCGGGIAGAEALLRLHRLANDKLDVTLISPDDDLVYRPLTVVEPFARDAVRRYPIARIAADAGARWMKDSLAWLDREQRVVHTSGANSIGYDALLLAIGGRERSHSNFADTFTGRDGGDLYRKIIEDIGAGRVTRLAFVLPPGPAWPLPLYELAIMTARFARYGAIPLDISVSIADARPLAVLGPDAGLRIELLLGELGITLHANTDPLIPARGRLSLHRGEPDLEVDRIVTLPSISGPNIAGIPGFAFDRFLHIDEFGQVRNAGGRIFAAGDATDQPVKQGGISAQQADTAAAAIVHLAGLGPRPAPLRPRIDAKLITGGVPIYLSAYVIDGLGWQTSFHDQPPWSPDDKIAAEELGPYLRSVDDDVRLDNVGVPAPAQSAAVTAAVVIRAKVPYSTPPIRPRLETRPRTRRSADEPDAQNCRRH